MIPTNFVVIGVGNEYRRDDGVGPAVARAVGRSRPGWRVLISDGEPTAMLDAWAGTRLAVVVDATVGTGPPGAIRRHEIGDASLARRPRHAGSHSLGPAEAWALSRIRGVDPGRVVVYTLEVAEVGYGVGLTPATAAALPAVVRAVIDECER
ncbi:hydrogenase maturation protease [Rhodococcus indonesiensis]